MCVRVECFEHGVRDEASAEGVRNIVNNGMDQVCMYIHLIRFLSAIFL